MGLPVYIAVWVIVAILNLVRWLCLCAVDFVLRDPRESQKEPAPVALPVHREEIALLPKPWHRSFVQACNTARSSLHVTSPCMQQLLQLWFTSYRCIICFILCEVNKVMQCVNISSCVCLSHITSCIFLLCQFVLI